MKAYGSKRTYGGCRVVRAYDNASRKIKVGVKNHKAARTAKVELV